MRLAALATLLLTVPVIAQVINNGTGSGGSGTVAVENTGSPVGSAATLNFIPGSGLTISTSAPVGGILPIQISPDSSVIAPIAAVQSGSYLYGVGAGIADAQTATFTPTLTALTVGMQLCWTPVAANATTTPTFNPQSLGAATIVKAGGALVANDLITTAQACARYDGTHWELQNPQTSASLSTTVTMDLPVGGYNGAGAGLFPAWSIISGTSGILVSGRAAITFEQTGTPTIARIFRWPANWNNAQPVSVLIELAETSFNGGNYAFDVALACDASGTATGSAPAYGTPVASGTLASPSGHTYELTLANVGTQSCAASESASIEIYRDNTVASNIAGNVDIMSASLKYSIK